MLIHVIEQIQPPGARFRDRDDPKVADWIKPYTGAQDFDVALLGAPLSKTSISHSAAFALPDAIRKTFAAFTPYSVHHRLDLSDRLRLVDIGNVQMHLTDLAQCQTVIQAVSKSYWQQHKQTLVLMGGDHSVTGASVLGLVQASKQKYGIIHFDAHHDVRNLRDGGRTNGTPFRTLLESGAIDGKHLVQIGLRDFSNAKAYHRYVLEHGATVYSARDVRRQGLGAVLAAAMEVARQGTDAIYVSFDMDVLDQSFVPGVPAPTPGGLDVWEAIDALEWLGSQADVAAMDIVCADPSQDHRDLTTRVASTLILSFLTGLALRE
jgi:formiminoglutamase